MISSDFAPFFFVSANQINPIFQFFQQSQIVNRHHRSHFLAAPPHDHTLLSVCCPINGVCKALSGLAGRQMGHDYLPVQRSDAHTDELYGSPVRKVKILGRIRWDRKNS
jgi:hypothetical protein